MITEKRFKYPVSDQSFLLPFNIRNWLPRDHFAYFISDNG